MCIPVHLKSGSYVQNSSKGKRERVGRILQMHADSREEITEVFMQATLQRRLDLKILGTGDTLCDDKHLIILESMDFPEPVISVAM